MASSSGQKEINKDWPNTDGIIAGTTTQKGHKMQLEAETSVVESKEKIGFT